MLRLVLLSGACLAVIGLVMATADPNKKRDIAAPTPTETTFAQEIAPEPQKREAPTASQLAPDSGAAAVSAPKPPKQTMPGPALRPSPQYPDSPPVNTVSIAADSTAPSDDQRRITGDRINMRAGPDTSHAVINSLSEGDLVIALGAESQGWIQIRTADGKIGYVAGRFLSAQSN